MQCGHHLPTITALPASHAAPTPRVLVPSSRATTPDSTPTVGLKQVPTCSTLSQPQPYLGRPSGGDPGPRDLAACGVRCLPCELKATAATHPAGGSHNTTVWHQLSSLCFFLQRCLRLAALWFAFLHFMMGVVRSPEVIVVGTATGGCKAQVDKARHLRQSQQRAKSLVSIHPIVKHCCRVYSIV